MRRLRELRLLLAIQGCIAFVALVVVVPQLVDCISIEVSTSIEKGKVKALTDIAEDYNRADHRLGGRCIEVNVHGTASGKAMLALDEGWTSSDETAAAEPQVWMPTWSAWLDLLRFRDKVPGLPSTSEVGSVAQSTLVIAMPQPMAEALRLDDQEVTWQRMLELAQMDWATKGHPEWHEFTFAKDDPTRSTSGLAATVAAFYAGTGKVLDNKGALQSSDLGNEDVQRFVLGVEAGVHYYPEDIVDFLGTMAAHDSEDPEFKHPYVSAAVVQEQLVYEYNRGVYNDGHPPHTKLVALYPTDGALQLDHPYVVLPSADPDQRKAAQDFLTYLLGSDAQAHLTDAGFRDREGDLALPGGASEYGLHLDLDSGPLVVPPPSGEVLQTIQDTWSHYRKKARILLVLDSSASMGSEFSTAGGPSRFEVMETTLTDGLEHLPEDDEIGLWTFPGDDGNGSHSELVPISPFTSGQKRLILTEIHDLAETGGRSTPLHRAVLDAYEYLSNHPAEDRINAVVVLTDGEDHDETSSLDRDELLARLDPENAGPMDHPSVKVFSIALPDASSATMRSISDRTGAESYSADDRSSLADAFVTIFTSL
jgi:Ca-activated chloride channel family protein